MGVGGQRTPAQGKQKRLSFSPLKPNLQGTCLEVQWLRLRARKAGASGSIPGQGARSHMLPLRAGTAK